MPDSQQILDAVQTRLVQAREEIAALQAARTALVGQVPTNRPPRRTAGPLRAPKQARVPLPATRVGSSNGSSPSTAPKARRTSTPAPSARSRNSRPLPDGAIESLLSENAHGLSAAALSKLTGASRARVTARLRELERAGDVRRSGARRTSRWQIVTDEERIAERAAELGKTRRRSKLTASQQSTQLS